MTKDFTIDDRDWYTFIYLFSPSEAQSGLSVFSFNVHFFAIVAIMLSLRGCQTPEKSTCFASGPVKLTNTMLGVRDRGFVCTKEIWYKKKVELGPGLMELANKWGEPTVFFTTLHCTSSLDYTIRQQLMSGVIWNILMSKKLRKTNSQNLKPLKPEAGYISHCCIEKNQSWWLCAAHSVQCHFHSVFTINT